MFVKIIVRGHVLLGDIPWNKYPVSRFEFAADRPYNYASGIATDQSAVSLESQLCVCIRPCRHYTEHIYFAPIEETLTSALVGLSEYYTTNQLRANPTMTQVSLFHLRNRPGTVWTMWYQREGTSRCILASHWTERCHTKHTSRRPKRKSEQETTSSAN